MRFGEEKENMNYGLQHCTRNTKHGDFTIVIGGVTVQRGHIPLVISAVELECCPVLSDCYTALLTKRIQNYFYLVLLMLPLSTSKICIFHL